MNFVSFNEINEIKKCNEIKKQVNRREGKQENG